MGDPEIDRVKIERVGFIEYEISKITHTQGYKGIISCSAGVTITQT